MAELGVRSIDAYRDRIARDPAERRVLDSLTRITISRFHRDRGVFEALRERFLPELAERIRARGDNTLACWSTGCASGEEPYTLAIAWLEEVGPRFPEVELRIVATDADPTVIERARRGRYDRATLEELPGPWIEAAFERLDADEEPFRLRPAYRESVEFRLQDVRRLAPDGPFDLVLCRNLVFTYFDASLQTACLERIATRMRPGGVLVLGAHESLPDDRPEFERAVRGEPIYRLDPTISP